MSSKEEKNGAYCYVDVSNNYPFQNKIIDSSITKTEGSTGYSNIHSINGAVNITSTNVSQVYTDTHQIGFIHDINADSTIRFSTFENNTQKSWSLATYLWSGLTTINVSIDHCNYLNNKGANHIIGCYKLTALISNCNFVDNVMTQFSFYAHESGNMTIDQCYINNFQGTSGAVSITRTLDKQIILNLNHLSTFECDAVIPLMILKSKPEITDIIGIKPMQCIPECIYMAIIAST